MDLSIYKYVNKFPKFNSIFSENVKNPTVSVKSECTRFKEELTQYDNINDLFLKTCTEFAEHHKDIKNAAESSEIALCKYINYWIYDTLMSKQIDSHVDLLNKFYGKFTNLKFCDAYKKPINKSTYDELTELYNLHDHFIKFKQESTKDQSPICNEAEEIFKLYEKYAGKCKWNYNNYFCWELMKFRVDYEHNRFHSTRCMDHMNHLRPIGNDRVSIILFPFVVMSLISFVFIYLYNFTSFDSWLLSKLPGAKKKTKKKVHRMHELQRTSEMEGRRYKLPYHSS